MVVEATNGDRYAAFFDVRRFRKVGEDAVHLMVQSAYVLDKSYYESYNRVQQVWYGEPRNFMLRVDGKY